VLGSTLLITVADALDEKMISKVEEIGKVYWYKLRSSLRSEVDDAQA
jgi:hypothetical protein